MRLQAPSLATVAILGSLCWEQMGAQTVRRKDLWSPNTTKISQMNRQPNFLSYVAPLEHVELRRQCSTNPDIRPDFSSSHEFLMLSS